MHRIALLALPVVLAACAGGDSTGDGADTGDGMAGCDSATVYADGVSLTAGDWDVAFVSASPSPPDEGDNDWVLAVTDSSGAAVSGLTVTVEPWMPEHGHGVSPATYDGTEGTAGEYTIPTFDLIMPGAWEFRFTVSDGTNEGNGSITFCAEG